MKLNTYDVRCAALSDYGGINSHDFDEWLGAYKPWQIEEAKTADLIDPKPVPEEER